MRKVTLALMMFTALGLLGSRASAGQTYDFTYSDGNESLTGVFTTSSVQNGDGSFTIIGITGTASGVTTGEITGVLPPGGFDFNDNELFPNLIAGSYIDFSGIGIAIGSVDANLFGFGFGTYGYEDSSPYNRDLAISSTDFTLSPASVPEPSSLLIAGTGLGISAVAIRFGRRKREIADTPV
jgi:PEP-CTERM motif